MSSFDTSHLFNHLPNDALDRLTDHAREVHLAPGDIIFRQGDPGDGLYFVKSGEVEISEVTASGERRYLGMIAAGEVFGEMAVLDGQPRSAWAKAQTNATVCFVPSEEIMCLLEEYPELALKFLRSFSGRLRKINAQRQSAA
jgi:CRP/FNR family transcriptional regulator, cyclic AMP receptor protein